jgi:Ca2+-transporting ATPase
MGDPLRRTFSTRRNDPGNGVFAFTAEQLGTLHNIKNPRAFLNFGGVEGLINGLASHRTKGIGGSDGQRTTPRLGELVRRPTLREAVTGFSIFGARDAHKNITSEREKPQEIQSDVALIADRKAAFLDNQLPILKQPTFVERLWSAYNDPVLFLLTAAAVVSLAIGLYQTFSLKHTADNPPVEWVEGVAILVAVVIIVLVSTINDLEMARQFKKLNQKEQEQEVKVVRFGKPQLIHSSEVLVGDVVLLEPGDLVPADGILLTGHKIMCQESVATGEAELVHKTPGDEVFAELTQRGPDSAQGVLPKLDPFMISGTEVLGGTGSFLVTATGLNSFLGKIISEIKQDTAPTPLQERLAILAKTISQIGWWMAGIMFGALMIRFLASLPTDLREPAEKGKNFVDIVIISLTVLVIAVPEGLPLTVVLSLAFATVRMLKDHNLVRQLKACETMGNTTSVCSDKTGTMTLGKMAVVTGTFGATPRYLDLPDHSSSINSLDDASSDDFVQAMHYSIRDLLLQSIAVNSTAFESKDGTTYVGSTTESALLNFARKCLGMGLVQKERDAHDIVQLIPFDGVNKCMAAVIVMPGSPRRYRVFIKGAAEILLDKSTRIVDDINAQLSDVPMTSQIRESLVDTIRDYARQSLRTISLVYRDIEIPKGESAQSATDFTLDYLLRNLVFLGVVGIRDPLRRGVVEAVHNCQTAGVTVRMVTGDNLLTAVAIARESGILPEDAHELAAIEGVKFRNMSDSELREAVIHLRVLARSTPDDKQKLVELLKEMGEVVAVTGDGTNDAAAMSSADVSFAMGLTGTDIARKASSIILLNNDFTCIVNAIMWGRAVNDSVKKFLQVCCSRLSTTLPMVILTAMPTLL